MLSASEAAARTEPATVEDAEDALALVMGALGHRMDPGRIATVALILAGSGWTRAELDAAARVLAVSPKLRDALRYGGTLTPADFEDVRRGEERTERDEEGEERVITTLRGYALRVKRERLFTYAEAMGVWTSAGSPGRFGDSVQAEYADAMFTPVRVEGQEKPLWRLK